MKRFSVSERVLIGLAIVSMLTMSLVLVVLVMSALSHAVVGGNK